MATFSNEALNAVADFLADKTYSVRLFTDIGTEVLTSIGYTRATLDAADYADASSGRADATGSLNFGEVNTAVTISHAKFFQNNVLWITHEFSSPINVLANAIISIPTSLMPDFLVSNRS